jgi:hypothetical protein
MKPQLLTGNLGKRSDCLHCQAATNASSSFKQPPFLQPPPFRYNYPLLFVIPSAAEGSAVRHSCAPLDRLKIFCSESAKIHPLVRIRGTQIPRRTDLRPYRAYRALFVAQAARQTTPGDGVRRRIKMWGIAAESLGPTKVDENPSDPQPFSMKSSPLPLSSRPKRTRISCDVALKTTACAAFGKESCRNFACATNTDRKSGVSGAEGPTVLQTSPGNIFRPKRTGETFDRPRRSG